MITIVCDQRNTGKTRWMQKHFNRFSEADGFLSVKVFSDSAHKGYDLLDLQSGETTPFIRKPEFIESGWNELFRLGNHYSFNSRGFKRAETICSRAIFGFAETFFLDEVGPLELQGKGFARIFSHILQSGMDIVVAVRRAVLEDVITKFKLENYSIITPWEGEKDS